MSASKAPDQRLLALRTASSSALVAIAVVASMHALTRVIEEGDWIGVGTRFVVLLAVVTGVTRYTLQRRSTRPMAPPRALLPSLVGLVVAVWGVLALYGGPTERFNVAVGLSNVGRIVNRLIEGRDLAAAETAPIAPSLPIELMAIGGVVLVFLLVDVLVGGLNLPGAAAIPVLALWAPGLVMASSIPVSAFVVTVLALLLLLAVDNPYRTLRTARPSSGAGDPATTPHPAPARRGADRSGAGQRRTASLRVAGTLGAAAGVTIVAMLLGTTSAALPSLAGSAWSRIFSSTGQTVRLADDLDMERNLGERSGDVVMRYNVEDDKNIGPLRVFTLTGFDGTNWRRGSERDGASVDDTRVLWPQDGIDTSDENTQRVSVTLETLRETRLPLPTEPRSLDIQPGWSYDAIRDEVTSRRSTTPGMSYGFTMHERPLTAENLRKSTGPDVDDPNYLDLPESSHEQEIRDLAGQITDGIATRYDKALALQTYFRDASRFTYSTEVPRGATDDSVWNFLQDRRGYCVQFATSMTMLARALGMPARLGVGFLPGTRSGESSTYEVTGRQSHAWPEIYFPGQGWVRFEPTPAVQTGPAPAWADPLLSPLPPTNGAGPSEVPTAVPSQVPSASAPSAPTTAGGPAVVEEALPAWAWALAAVVILLVVAGGLTWLVRRRSRPEAVLDPEHAWTELASRLESQGIRWSSSTTPRKVPEAVIAQVHARTGRRLSDTTVDALVELATGLEEERYARRSTAPRAARLEVLVETVSTGVAEGLSDRPARDDAPSALRVG